jgi:hypothetical protein
MPKGTKVEKMYQAMKREGMDAGKAARIAQAKTGLALATGKPPKGKKRKKRPEAIKRFMNRRNKRKVA